MLARQSASTGLAAVLMATTLLILPQTLKAAPAPEPQSVLFIGNSFLRGINRHLSKFYRTSGSFVRVKQVGPNGWTLGRHAGSTRTQKRIDRLPWDVIVLQEQSDGIDEDRYPDARYLDERAQENGAATMFFMTWRDRGADLEDYESLLGVPDGNEGYLPIANELGASIAPVGWAIRAAVEGGTPYDLWRDGHHLNKGGRYLAACVFWAALTGQTPVGLTHPNSLDPLIANYLQELAAETVLGDLELWNLD